MGGVKGYKAVLRDYGATISELTKYEMKDKQGDVMGVWYGNPKIRKMYYPYHRYTEDVIPKVAEIGMHFCENLIDCLDSSGIYLSHLYVLKVEAIGDISVGKYPDEFAKLSCTNDLKIYRRMSNSEIIGELIDSYFNSTNFDERTDFIKKVLLANSRFIERKHYYDFQSITDVAPESYLNDDMEFYTYPK